jgi:hypothetical protein
MIWRSAYELKIRQRKPHRCTRTGLDFNRLRQQKRFDMVLRVQCRAPQQVFSSARVYDLGVELRGNISEPLIVPWMCNLLIAKLAQVTS